MGGRTLAPGGKLTRHEINILHIIPWRWMVQLIFLSFHGVMAGSGEPAVKIHSRVKVKVIDLFNFGGKGRFPLKKFEAMNFGLFFFV